MPLASINARTVLALSGFAMLAFVVVHLAGNTLAFAGRETFNAYSRSLREIGTPIVAAGVALWIARVVLVTALVAHLSAHARLLFKSGGAPSLILLASGGVILLFVAFHLAQLTFGVGQTTFASDDPYDNLVTALRSWPVAVGYIVVGLALAAHVRVGVWSGMYSLGLTRAGRDGMARVTAAAFAGAVFLAMAAIPVASLVGRL